MMGGALWGLVLLAGLGIVAPVAPAHAVVPQVAASVDTTRLTLGDPFWLRLRLRHAPEYKVDLPAIEDRLEGFVVGASKWTDPQVVDGVVEQVVGYELRSFQLGEQHIPALEIPFLDAQGNTLLRSTEPVALEVISVREAGEEGPRDIKPPVEVPGGIPLWLAGMLAALAAVGMMAVLYWWLNRRPQGASAVAEPPPPPIDYAAEFNRIAARGLADQGRFKEHYSLLSELLRRFIEEHLRVDALEQTTGELVRALAQTDLPAGLVGQVDQFLGEADLAKFARFQPPMDSARQAPHNGVELVRSIKEHINAQQRRAREMAAAQAAP